MTIRTAQTLMAFPLLVALASGCAFQQKKVERELEQPAPINCATAQGDLRVLQGEKAHVAQRVVEGATAIYPASLVMGILTGTEGTKLSVATGEYNHMIEARIAAIEEKCGIE
jgi:hypothetical protein